MPIHPFTIGCMATAGYSPPTWSNTHSILMDGVDEYVSVPSAATSGLNGKAGGSFSCWVKRSSVGGSRRYFLGLAINASTAKLGLNFETNNRIRVLAASSVSDGLKFANTSESFSSTSTWYNITVCVDVAGDAWDVYVNGATLTISNPTFADSTFSSEVGANHNIGAWMNNGIVFPGNVNQCALWDKCLSAAEATEIYNSGVPADLTTHSAASNIVSYWPFGTGDTYPTLLDSVNSHDGTMTNMESGDIVTDVP